MKIMVVGSGGREHALAWKLAQSPRVERILVAPGNGGTFIDSRLRNVAAHTPQECLKVAQDESVEITLVGPEDPLAQGIVDLFRDHGIKIFGPTQAASQLESSKAFSKAFMQRHQIPTAAYQSFTNIAQAHEYVDKQGVPIVIKADGLAAGKGVVVAMTLDEAHQAIDDMLGEHALGCAGHRIIIEEYLIGEEASFIVMVDGKNILPLATSQDHKRLYNGDTGPNTGGMGAYSPAPLITPMLHARIMREIIQPTVDGLMNEGISFTGFLYAGIMIDTQGNPQVLEFNCRMGDPETQVIMTRLRTDFVDVLAHAVNGTLDSVELNWDHRTALGVVLAAHGYPQKPRKNDVVIGIPDETENSVIFHAGTKWVDHSLVTNGGRILCVVGLADNVKVAQTVVYNQLQQINFNGMQYRHDIGHRAIKINSILR